MPQRNDSSIKWWELVQARSTSTRLGETTEYYYNERRENNVDNWNFLSRHIEMTCTCWNLRSSWKELLNIITYWQTQKAVWVHANCNWSHMRPHFCLCLHSKAIFKEARAEIKLPEKSVLIIRVCTEIWCWNLTWPYLWLLAQSWLRSAPSPESLWEKEMTGDQIPSGQIHGADASGTGFETFITGYHHERCHSEINTSMF